jgi:hypothetical protein
MLGQYSPLSTHLPPILAVPNPNLPDIVAEKALERLGSPSMSFYKQNKPIASKSCPQKPPVHNIHSRRTNATLSFIYNFIRVSGAAQFRLFPIIDENLNESERNAISCTHDKTHCSRRRNCTVQIRAVGVEL